MRIGIMGGAFDPIHNAHIRIAQSAKNAHNLDRVLFIAAGDPPHKRLSAGVEDRLRMVSLAIQGLDWAESYENEARREGMTYTVDTMERLCAERPGDSFFYIVGADALRDMLLWRNAPRVMELCEIIAAPRPGMNADATRRAKQEAQERIGAKVHLLEDIMEDISSTSIRESISKGEDAGKIPESVSLYIRQRGLYR